MLSWLVACRGRRAGEDWIWSSSLPSFLPLPFSFSLLLPTPPPPKWFLREEGRKGREGGEGEREKCSFGPVPLLFPSPTLIFWRKKGNESVAMALFRFGNPACVCVNTTTNASSLLYLQYVLTVYAQTRRGRRDQIDRRKQELFSKIRMAGAGRRERIGKKIILLSKMLSLRHVFFYLRIPV